jgi:hypothetical protein
MNDGLEVEDHVRFMRRAIELSLRAGLVEKSGGAKSIYGDDVYFRH